MRRLRVLVTCALGLALASCIQDADTILEPDPVADAGGDAEAPEPTRFPAVEIDPPMVALDGMGAVVELTLLNVGDAPLRIEGVGRDGNPGFAVAHDGRNALLLDGDALSGADGVAPGESVVIAVEALVGPPASATLIIATNDPERPRIDVPVGFPDAPCLTARPEELDFGVVTVGDTVERILQIENCAERALTLDRLAFQAGTDPQFSLGDDVQPDREIPPGESVSLTVRYTARAPAGVFGSIRADAEGAHVVVPLTARGQATQCPVAAILEPDIRAELGDVLVLDGGASFDRDGPEGLPQSWRWTIVEQPEGAVSRIVEHLLDAQRPDDGGPDDDPATPSAQVHLDAVGLYVFELEVADESCADRMRLAVEVCPCGDTGIVAVLDWASDEPPPAGMGVDLDLHLLHPNAEAWFSRPYDCHYAEPTPDWGQLDNPADDPALDQDRIGAGPERIRLAIPENTDVLGAPYLVGAHYQNHRGAEGERPEANVMARVRVFVRGVVQFDELQALDLDNLWDVAQVEWPSGEVRARGRVYPQRP